MKKKSAGMLTAKDFFYRYNCFFILLLLIIISAFLSPVFLSKQNVFNVMRQQVPIALMSIGALLVILTGGIDLSTGANLALSNTIIAFLLTNAGINSFGGLALSIPSAILTGAIVGALNGILIAYLRMPAFIATLGVMTIARGVAYIATKGTPIRPPTDPVETPGSAALYSFGQGGDPIIGMPWAVWVVILLVVFFWFLMKYTSFGRLIMATRSNATATRLAGVNVRRYKFAAYTICGALAGIAGIMMCARAGIATPSAGTGFELESIAAVVIGGASLSGGKGHIANSIVGVFILALISNIMALLSVPPYPQQVIQGAIIITAVLLNLGKDK